MGKEDLPSLLSLDPEASLGLDADEDATLAAALSFIDECSSTSSSSEAVPPASVFVSAATVAPEPKSKKKKRNYNPNKAREERRKELLYLRNKVQEMEGRVVNMKQTLGKRSSDTMSSTSDPSESASPIVFRNIKLWRSMAIRQSEERSRAETENARLKLAVESHHKTSQSLLKLIERRNQLDADANTTGASCRSTLRATPRQAKDPQVFEELLRNIQDGFRDVDQLFPEHAATAELKNRHAKIHSDGPNGLYIDIFADMMLPFAWHTTAHCVWDNFSLADERAPFRYYERTPQVFGDVELYTIYETFEVEMHTPGQSEVFRINQIWRKRVEEERTVIIWRAYIEPLDKITNASLGMHFFEQGYYVIRKVEDKMTLMQTLYKITPVIHDDCTASERMSPLTQFVLDVTSRNIGRSHQMIENFLVDRELNGTLDSLVPECSA